MSVGTRRARRGPPVFVGVVAAVAIAFFALPLIGMLERAPWSDVWGDLTADTTVDALRLSLVCSLAATALSLLFGVPLAWVLARAEFPGRRLARALVTLPMVLPPVVGGVALFLAFGRNGFVGQHLDAWFGLRLPFSTGGVIVAETFVAMPFLVVAVEGALRSADIRYEEAGAVLGARRMTVFRRVTLPMIAPAVAAGAVLSWARAIGEFGATITFAGNFPGTTQTMPLAIFGRFEAGDLDGSIALSLVLVGVSIAVLVGLRDRWLHA
ncbi:MAG: ABC transporter permease [Acidimicrobiia bacterium]